MTVINCGGGDDGDDPSGNTDPKSITITGIPAEYSNAYISVIQDITSSPIAESNVSHIPISGGSVTGDLFDFGTDNPWTGSGPYYIYIQLEPGYNGFYTDGQSLSDLGITSESDKNKLPKYNISSANSTIPFSKFEDVSSYMH